MSHYLTRLDYISGVPGLGKTTWAIEDLTKLLINDEGPVIYVAPTRLLIKQIAKDVVKALIKAGFTKEAATDRIIKVHGTNTRVKGLSIERMLKAAIEGEDIPGLAKMPAFTKGTVIFMTHEGFYSLGPYSIFLPLRKTITVYFDEAKKSVFNRTSIKMDEEAATAFNSMFVKERYEETSYYKLTPSKNCNDTTLNTVTKGLSNWKQRIHLHTILEDVKNPSLEVYISTNEIKAGTRFYGVTLPSKVFKGFKRVTLMAAYFEDSQMYHLLKADKKNRLRDITQELPNYRKRNKEIRERYSRAVIVPLTAQDRVLTLSSLQGILIRKSDLLNVQDKLDEIGLTKEELQRLINYIHTGYSIKQEPEKIKKAHKIITTAKISKDPMRWYLRRSEAVVNYWSKKNKTSKVPLMFVNKVYQDNVDSEKFRIVSTYSHGINTYSGHHIAAFLAAINPDRQMVNFMAARVGSEYNYQKDFVVDTCLQSVSRTNIRDTSSSDRILIIVPDSRLAEYVRESMFLLPRVDTRYALRFGDYVNFNLRTIQKLKKESPKHIDISTVRRRKNVKKAVAKFNECPINKQISNVRSYISHAKKKLKGAALDERLEVLNERLTKLLEQRLENT